MTRCHVPAPMTAEKAAALVERLKAETPKAARVAVLGLALRKGNLSDGAREVYRRTLDDDQKDTTQ